MKELKETLSRGQAKDLMLKLIRGEFNPAQTAAILTRYYLNPVTTEELLGFKEALLELAVKIDLEDNNFLDLCGTGGDGKDTFNISTITALVVASMGQKVAKHGNYASSSLCGSSNVLESAGLKFSNKPEYIKACLEEANICFLHAPLFHPALKGIAPIRKELGFRTIFNLLGPLVNPLKPKFQFTGVANLETLKLYQSVLSQNACEYGIAYSYDGYDEISLTGRFVLLSSRGDKEFTPEELGLQSLTAEELSAGGSQESAGKIFQSFLNQNASEAQKQVIEINAALAYQLCKPETTLDDCRELARETLASTKLKETFNRLVELSAKYG